MTSKIIRQTLDTESLHEFAPLFPNVFHTFVEFRLFTRFDHRLISLIFRSGGSVNWLEALLPFPKENSLETLPKIAGRHLGQTPAATTLHDLFTTNTQLEKEEKKYQRWASLLNF